MKLTKEEEFTFNFLQESVSQKIGALDFLAGDVRKLRGTEHEHSVLQIGDALIRARKELEQARTLAANIINGYYEGIVANAKAAAVPVAEPANYPKGYTITNDIVRVIEGLHREYPNEGGADLGRRLNDLFKPHELRDALAELTFRPAWTVSEPESLMNAQTLIGVVMHKPDTVSEN